MYKLLLLLVLVLFSHSSFALGKLGHKVVCQLAFDQLSLKKQQTVTDLLALIPENDRHAINQYLRAKVSTPITFAKACTWADAIKREPEYKQFKTWHYINVARNTTQLTDTSCKKNCITQAIAFHRDQLEKAANDNEKAKALMFLGHWVGDIHQPFHVSFASDLGGNRINVTPFKGRCSNIHWYWDECLLYPEPRVKENLTQYWYSRLSGMLTKANRNLWLTSDTIDWANESLAIVTDKETGYCQYSNSVCEKGNITPYVIDKTYHQNQQQLLATRMAQASIRLAKIIEQSL
ncbi:S1/P1 nuclease [Thalassotalea sediminis]|uniref:S1/P1 nuclease n=1 Tax=Thalassotalea sediminis TaxID=1759089 RepID=UPI0025736441|nr:S1/P1 nuclease [Thalassotalea sediminis]